MARPASASDDVGSELDRNQWVLFSDRSSLRHFALTLLAVVVPLVFGLLFAIWYKSRFDGQIWFAILVPFCGGLVGLLLGFLYATVGRETAKFGPALTAIGSALSGAGAVELVRPGGTLRVFFAALASSVGLAEHAALVGLMLVASATAGFLWMYVLKTLLLNSEILRAQEEEDGYNRAVQQINSPQAQRAVNDPSSTAEVPKDVVEAAKQITSATKPADVPSLRERGKAQYLQGQYLETIGTMQEVLSHVPNDRGALLHLASSLLNIKGREVEAVPFLERLVSDPAAPCVAWKLLGYALLFVDDPMNSRAALDRSLKATAEYLRRFPDDPGSLLNRACAFAQLAVTDKKLQPALWKAVEEASRAGGEPARQQMLGSLSEPGMDFEKWAQAQEFKDAISRGAGPPEQ